MTDPGTLETGVEFSVVLEERARGLGACYFRKCLKCSVKSSDTHIYIIIYNHGQKYRRVNQLPEPLSLFLLSWSVICDDFVSIWVTAFSYSFTIYKRVICLGIYVITLFLRRKLRGRGICNHWTNSKAHNLETQKKRHSIDSFCKVPPISGERYWITCADKNCDTWTDVRRTLMNPFDEIWLL